MKKTTIYIVLMIVSLVYACRNGQEELAVKGEEYFPVEIGNKHLYSIDTIVYDLFKQKIDTFSNIVQEEVVEKYVDLSGDTVYRIELSTYNQEKFKYVVFKSFERKIKGNYAMEKMENGTEVKMIFPISNYKTKGSTYTWNSNMFNGREPQIVKYTSVFTSYNNGNKNYSNCVSIKLSKPQTGIINNIKEEVYAKNVGLIYRFTDSTDYLQNDTFPSGKKTIIKLIN